MSNYNPIQEYQRNQLLAQQAMIQQQLVQLGQPQMQQPPQYTPQPPTPQYYVREVSGFEDVKKVPPDPCATYLFPDTSTGKIYMKRLNSDTGRSEYFVYAIENDTESANSDPMQQLNARLERIEKILGGMNEPVSESGANAEVYAEPNGSNTKSNAAKNAKTKSANVSECTADDKR